LKNTQLALLLHDIIIFPHQEVKLEFKNNTSKIIIESTLMEGKKEIVVISSPLKEAQNLKLKDLPKIGLNAKIKQKIILPNGNMRVILQGLKRVKIKNINFNNKNLIEVKYENFALNNLDLDKDEAYINKLIKMTKKYYETIDKDYTKMADFLETTKSLNKITDIISFNLNIDYEFKKELFILTNTQERAKKLLSFLNKLINSIKIENKLEEEVRTNFEKNEKEIIIREKIKILNRELNGDIEGQNDAEKFAQKIKKLKINPKLKSRMIDEVRKFEMTNENSPEHSILRNYLEFLTNLPWDRESKDTTDITSIDKHLNKLHYGINEAKNRIKEYLVLKEKNNKLHSPILCLIGPPGTGKTTFARELAKSIGREFIKISVGGLNDSSELLGHRKTYIGAGPGKIMDGIKKCGAKNPVILIDEVDKMVKDYKGDPASVLLDILDPKQNHEFIDNYLGEPFDLSKVIFILTANLEDDIPAPLYDRLEVIEVNSYTLLDKIEIAKNYTLPRLGKEYNFDHTKIKMSDTVITKIALNYTMESGMRDLERKISSIIRQVLIKGLDEEVTITEKDITKYLGNPKYYTYENNYEKCGTVNVPAYTPLGGSILNIECTMYEGNGEIIVSGNIGSVMEESIEVAMSYLKANYRQFKIDYKKFSNTFHVHSLEASSKKDGPSAGLAITTALVSLLTNKKVPNNMAFTGEISLNGRVMRIGGLKEKIISAYNKGINKVYIPKENENNLNDIPKKILKNMEIIPINSFYEVYKDIFM